MTFRIVSSMLLVFFLSLGATPGFAADDEGPLSRRVSVKATEFHQRMLEQIADDNAGHRASGTAGYEKSVDYVARWFWMAGYKVQLQEFEFPFFQEVAEPVFEQLVPAPQVYTPNVDTGFRTMTYSGSGDVTAQMQAAVDVIIPPGPVESTSNCGCEPEDFAGFVPGRIALVQRGTCTYRLKAENASKAGAAALIIFNEGQPGRQIAMLGTLGTTGLTIPVIATSYDNGKALYELSQIQDVTLHIKVQAIAETRLTKNIIADTPRGNPDNVVLVGAHLDSVTTGPGINDNGSGTAALIETAMKLAGSETPIRNKVRFAFWAAEELNLLGAKHYVAVTPPAELAKVKLYLNFDMIGSSNYVRFVYDGDGSDTGTAGPPGSGAIEQLFVDYYTRQGLPTDPMMLSTRFDYVPFKDAGIPIGGLCSGVDGIKTQEQVDKYGGLLGVPHDPYYHTPADTLANINFTIQEQLLRGIAHAVESYATGKAKLPARKEQAKAAAADSHLREYEGPLQVR